MTLLLQPTDAKRKYNYSDNYKPSGYKLKTEEPISHNQDVTHTVFGRVSSECDMLFYTSTLKKHPSISSRHKNIQTPIFLDIHLKAFYFVANICHILFNYQCKPSDKQPYGPLLARCLGQRMNMHMLGPRKLVTLEWILHKPDPWSIIYPLTKHASGASRRLTW